MASKTKSKSLSSPIESLSDKYLSKDTVEERRMLSRALQRPINPETKPVAKMLLESNTRFIWVNGYINWSTIQPGAIVSRIPSANAYFSKTQLSIALKEQMPFLYQKGEVDIVTPRTFEIRDPGALKDFCKQFRINACISILKIVVSLPKDNIATTEGTVPIDTVDFAVKRIVEYLQYLKHEDLDEWCFSVVDEEEWLVFLYRFYDVVHFDAVFLSNNEINVTKLQNACKRLLDILYKEFPCLKYEGKKNLWICKPANGSCGRGVKVIRKLEEILAYCKPQYSYVIQKYIEEPLLIYKTKFDIRQWFVITSVSPLIVWMYDECYLRFCSQEFSLNNLHESLHLCNNTIQWKYKNGERSSKLPKDNMWDNYTFADYLRTQLNCDQWHNIQDQMRQAIIAACLVSQEKMHPRPNSFHLYGADFMVTSDFKVWLIEINSQPSMKYSTSVTARMCKSVLEDTIKVGVERRLNPSANVRKFKEIYNNARIPKGANMENIFNSRKLKIFNHGKNVANYKITFNQIKKSIIYEEVASYKKQEKNNIKVFAKSEFPLDPGSTFCKQVISKEKNNLGPLKSPEIVTLETNTPVKQQTTDKNQEKVPDVITSAEGERNASGEPSAKQNTGHDENEAMKDAELKSPKQKTNMIKKKTDAKEKIKTEIASPFYEKVLEKAIKNRVILEDILFPEDKNKMHSFTKKLLKVKELMAQSNSRSTQTSIIEGVNEDLSIVEKINNQPEAYEIPVFNVKIFGFKPHSDDLTDSSDISECSDSEINNYTEPDDSSNQCI